MKLTLLQLRMLLVLASGHQPATGKGMIKYTKACRDLEKKGLAGKGVLWYATKDGDRFVKRALRDDSFKLLSQEEKE